MYIKNGLQEYKFAKGSQSLSFYLEKEIKNRGGEIHYSSFVNSIIQNENGVVVKTRNDQEFKADFLVIAAPPSSAKKISF